VSLARRVGLVVGLLHLPLAFLAWQLARDSRWGLVVAEGAVVLSLVACLEVLRLARAPASLAATGRALLVEGDFTTRFRAVGQRDVDELVALYNRLADELRHERLRVEERNLLLAELIEASPAGVLLCDFDGRIELANPAAARLAGCDRTELAGRPPAELPAPLGPALATLAPGEARVVGLAGGRRARLTRGEFADRGFTRSFLLVEELTEELRASERAAYEKVIRMVAHEVNNSAGAIGSLLESTAEMIGELAPAERTDADEALAVARRRMRHLASFVDGFAAVVRLPDPTLRPLDLGELARELVRLHRAEAERRGVVLEQDGDGAALAVEADREQVEQALVNLIRNALEATPAGGRVRLSVVADGAGAAIEVRDSGPGLAPEIADQLGTPFFTTKRDGRGLGLTLVREVARRHEARFELGNAAGGGAVARLRLGAAPDR
jgi:signal transduction histidine kinase